MHSRFRIGLAVALLVVAVSAAAATPQSTARPSIERVEYTGGNSVPDTGDRLHVWRASPHDFTLTIATDGSSSGELCLGVRNRTDGDLTCRSLTLGDSPTATVTVSVQEFPANVTGDRTFVFRFTNDTGDPSARTTLPVTVLTRDGDRDGDGLSNEREVDAGASPVTVDTDGDDLDDHAEVSVYGTTPTDSDTDDDELTDGAEVYTHRTDPTALDTDGDDLADGVERRQETDPNAVDTDGDALADGAELTTYRTDPTLVDTDGDGLGDGAELNEFDTDPTAADTDGDGLADGREVTVFATDPRSTDTDGDGLRDAVEIERHGTDPTVADTDDDEVDDAAEVEVYGTDPRAADTDSDGLPDGTEIRRSSDPTEPTVVDRGPFETAFAVATRRPVSAGVGVAVALAAAALLFTDRVGDGARSAVAPVARAVPVFGEPERSSAEPAPSAATDETQVLTNEEQVRELLETNDGRMLQSEIVEEADWSKATVSRVLSDMEENGAVTRINLGHGNLVTLPGEEPENAGAEFPDR